MKATYALLPLIAGAALTAAAAPVTPPTSHPDASAPGWVEVFKPDLSDAVFPKGVWSVTNGEMTATEDQAIWCGKEYDDFELDSEFKTAPASNSGVIIHCSDIQNWIPNSVEIQILDDHDPKWASAAANWKCGAAFGHTVPTKSTVKKPGEWNHMTVTCVGKNIWVMLNGERVTAMDMALWTSAKTNPDGTAIPPWLSRPAAELPLHGRIGLQGKHAGAPIWFRNVKIHELK